MGLCKDAGHDVEFKQARYRFDDSDGYKFIPELTIVNYVNMMPSMDIVAVMEHPDKGRAVFAASINLFVYGTLQTLKNDEIRTELRDIGNDVKDFAIFHSVLSNCFY